MRFFLSVCVLFGVGGCSAVPDDGSLRSIHAKARFDYRMQCEDDLIDGQNLPMAFASHVCEAHSRKVVPLLR